MTYYGGVNPDLLARLPMAADRVLEIGCGEGALSRAYRLRNPRVRYLGIELFDAAAEVARPHLDGLVVGDIETEPVRDAADAMLSEGPLDALVFGDVLEHLKDPWALLSHLRGFMAPDGVCVACIPNVAHWSILTGLLAGRWDYADAGLLDRTHLRFFTRKTAVDMFTQAGWSVQDAQPRVFRPDKVEAALKALGPAAKALGIDPAVTQRELSTFQWVVRATPQPTAKRLTVGALGLKKVAAVNEARIDYPLTALATRPAVRTAWASGSLKLPPSDGPGVLILHRQFVDNPQQQAMVERLAAQGWVVVSEMDDDPHRWPQYEAAGFRAFKGVHAVTVSTEPLAEMIRRWTPEVAVFPNAIFSLPEPADKPTDRVRVFFGALNRQDDWRDLMPDLARAAEEVGAAVEFTVVHDREFHDALPGSVRKTFHATLDHRAYMAELAASHIALLPLADTPFNRLKSDLKLIEACAAGAAPICSPVVYDARPEHGDVAVFAQEGPAWADALVRLVRDSAERERLAKAGQAYVAAERMHAGQVRARESYYRGLIRDQPRLEAARRARLVAMGVEDLAPVS